MPNYVPLKSDSQNTRMMSLATFLKKQEEAKKPPVCAICDLPEAKQINKGLADGIAIPKISDWLILERGYNDTTRPALSQRILQHKNKGHHESKRVKN